ncbi:mediator of RNA polymerase II transcription subunit 13 [Recurvomyces mirabilis]|uniref:Mediator of RNA polymerase II transcription subunit 13 n=1 Tax=Recurvomyces mirabilis TaxID=574656 RepID=A0AAE0WLJ8_9PEZI|nr:mediator of RNA polymerase II transcription subunit 13 [Recurvomyces mirabilis]KAK5151979.1 mediator of RNA polymerase II transcription subunit 13 [Recurvomyces mirabilis]
MDFFKSCKTNVQHIDDIWKTPATSYTHKSHDTDHYLVEELVKGLRVFGTLCAFTGAKLWVFGLVEDRESASIRDDGWVLDERGTLDAFQKTGAPSESMAEDILLEAIEGAVSHTLNQTGNITKMSPRTWLFTDTEEEYLLLRLSMRIADDGKLSIATNTAPSDLQRMNPSTASDGRPLLTLAPIGCRARLDRDNDQASMHASDEQWRALATEHFLAHGISISEEEDWMKLQLIDRPYASIEWPAKLCFEPRRGVRAAIDDTDWKQFFIPSEEEAAFKHPFEVAEDWCKNAASREQQIDTATAFESAAQPTSTLPDHDSVAVTSPPFTLRNAEQQAAASGIYPTPPDGIVPGQLSSQQHSSDAMAVDNPSGDSGPAAQDFSMTMEDQTVDLRASSTSDQAPTFNAEDSSNDLFGDMGGEMDFGSGEIGDADFDFFNEEDGADLVPVDDDVEEHVAEDGGVEDIQPHEDEVEGGDVSMVMADPSEHPTDNQALGDVSLVVEKVDESFTTMGPIIDTIDEMFPDQPDSTVKPLSPFAIKECLLPPPIPASVSHDSGATHQRKTSRFDAITFKEDLNIGRRFSELYGPTPDPAGNQRTSSASTKPDSYQERLKTSDNEVSIPHEYNEERSESEDGGSESASSPSDIDVPPKAPWSSKKRKRSDFEANGRRDEVALLLRVDDAQSHVKGHHDPAEMRAILDRLLSNRSPGLLPKHTTQNHGHETLGSVEEVLLLSKMDLVFVAQLVAEQAVTCTTSIVEAIDMLSVSRSNAAATGNALQTLVDQALSHFLPSMTSTDIASLALAREPITRNTPTPATPRPGQPRPPPPRPDTTNLGPDIVAIPPPYIRVQRGADKYEMLPLALQFWDTLSLAPINGTKDIRAFCVFPGNEDVQSLAETFLSALGTAYEECKLGSHRHTSNNGGDEEEAALGDYVDGLVPVDLGDDDEHSLEAAMQCYSEACTTLATFMANTAFAEPDRTFVIYIINPFRHHPELIHHLCACFWLLYQTYRKTVPRSRNQHPPSDIVLQILPIDLLAAPDSVVLLDAKQTAALAQEVYDRCPPNPSFEPSDTTGSALPNYSAPLFELASPTPKRIAFHLASETPADLLHEGSCLHLAYAVSGDGFWLTAAWSDNMGRYGNSVSFPLCGRSFKEVVGEVWERVEGVMGTRGVTWRVFIVGVGSVGQGVSGVWRGLVEGGRRLQAFSVTLLGVDLEPVLRLSPPGQSGATDEAMLCSVAGAGFLTPGSTPQGTTMTVSPDPSGLGNLPPTPAPSESTPAASGDTDPDAHLIDLTDETWAVLFSATTSQSLTHQLSKQQNPSPLCSGALFKRGNSDLSEASSDHLPSIGVSLYWTIQVRPSGAVDEGSVRQAEMTLREVLRMFRNLSVLSRARGLVASSGGGGDDGSGKGLGVCVPVHVCMAVRGAEALDRFLPAVKD